MSVSEGPKTGERQTLELQSKVAPYGLTTRQSVDSSAETGWRLLTGNCGALSRASVAIQFLMKYRVEFDRSDISNVVALGA